MVRFLNSISTGTLLKVISFLSGIVLMKGLSVYYGFSWATLFAQ